jgi:hypothetical protein
MINGFDIAIGLIVYNPTDLLSKRIELILAMGFELYLLDNTPQNSMLRDLFKNKNKVHYLTLGQNVGLGIGMSAICGQAYYDGYKNLLFFDQDTNFSNETLEYIVSFHEYNKNSLESYSIINFKSPNGINNSSQYNEYSFKETDLVINSGSLIVLEKLNKIGWFDISYFVDSVDYKFCLDSNFSQYKIGLCMNTPGFDHVTEQDDSEYSFFGKKFLARKYSNSRVKDTFTSLLKLSISAFKNFNVKYGRIFLRQFVIYVLVQSYVRLVSPNKK